jgi:phenylpyruvate tautomerase PptA (4-oxalocrotonate tautomerase family)
MKVLFSVAAIATIAVTASAQNISKFVISDEAAKKSLMKNEISADTAEKITQACVEFAKKNNIAVSVFILSPTGQILHAHRMDWQVPINIETAHMPR